MRVHSSGNALIYHYYSVLIFTFNLDVDVEPNMILLKNK